MPSLHPSLITIGSSDGNEAPQEPQSIEEPKSTDPSNGNPEFAITISQNHSAIVAVLLGGQKRPLDIDLLKEQCPEFADELISIQNANPNKQIKVNFNLDLVVFDLMMKFLENGNKLSDDELEKNAVDLLTVAYKYQIASLKTYCDRFLSKIQFSPEDVLDFLMHADKVNAPQLKSACFKYIHKNFDTISQTPDWKGTIKKYPELLTMLYRDRVDRYKFNEILVLIMFLLMAGVLMIFSLNHEQDRALLISAKTDLSACKDSLNSTTLPM